VAKVKTPTPFGFGGWVAVTKGTGMDVLMGNLVLTQEEVNPVMAALLDNDLEVTALHNHFFWDEPRIFYMHVHGHGTPADLAQKLKPALDLIGKGAPQPASTSAPGTTSNAKLDTAKLAQIVGTQGEQTGDVYKITVGRDDLKITEMGASINARMGLNTWAAFVGSNDNAAIAIYHTINGRRTEKKRASVKVASNKWHTLRVEFAANHFVVSFNGQKALEWDDDTFKDAGKVGVWTKADSVTEFDDFTYGAK